MKKLGDVLLTSKPFSEIVMGNTALVRAMLEAGTRVVTSYPGSPTPEIASAIGSIPEDKRPFHFQFSTNEKVAAEVAFGAALNDHLSTVFFKSVGLNVAADSLIQFALLNVIGGIVIILGDDPGANSSQNEQDNRHFARMGYIPVLEPACPSEAYRFYLAAAKHAQEKQMPVIVRMTTHVCHAKEKVSFGYLVLKDADNTPRFDPANGPYIPIAARVFPMKARALKNLAETEKSPVCTDLNTIVHEGNRQRGIITMGLPFLSLTDTLESCTQKPDILKLGMVWPFSKDAVREFLKTHAEVLILEELDDVLEKEIKALAFDEKIAVKIHGKPDAGEWIGEYSPDKVRSVLGKTWPDMVTERKSWDTGHISVPERPPQMCPGCGHRSAFHAIRKALSGNEITVADIGCHTLGFLPPYETGKVLLCMGASTGVGSGLSLFNKSRKVIAFLGDSTFFHAGLPGILNAVFNQHPITLIVMENGTTAMTGHQDHAGSGRNFNGPAEKIPIRRVLESLGIKKIYECDTYRQAELTQLLQQAMNDDEFSVVIARHPCMLKFHRSQKKKTGFAPAFAEIDSGKCSLKYECMKEFACPSFAVDEQGKVSVNEALCIGDLSCGQVCPQTAIARKKEGTE